MNTGIQNASNRSTGSALHENEACRAEEENAKGYVATTDQSARGTIIVFDPQAADWNEDEAIQWSWFPNAANGFADDQAGWGAPSDVKLRRSGLDGGLWMVVADSKGLAAVVPYPAGDTRRWSHLIPGNLHAIELLPDGNVAIAASNGGWVRIYTSSQGPDSATYAHYELPGGHGVLWDPAKEWLWALGDDYLVSLKITGTASSPVIEEQTKVSLPTPYGHDLSPVYGNPDRLWVTTGSGVYQFVKSARTWIEADAITNGIDRAHVKGHGNQPAGRFIQTAPKPGGVHEWTTDTVDFFLPNAQRTRKGAGFYKARVWHADYQ